MYEIADIVSLSLGLFSIIGSLYIGVRPLILNASIGSASWGTYNIFIIAWLVADCLNVTGSFVSSQLPFQMMYSCLQLVLTLIFIGQCFHYADKPSLTALSAYVPLDLSRKLHLLQIYPIVQYLGLDR